MLNETGVARIGILALANVLLPAGAAWAQDAAIGGIARTATVPLVPPQTLFEDRISRLDLRLSKIITVQRLRVQLNVDAYNVLNANSVRGVIGIDGPRWQQPQQILDPRLFQFGGQISF